MRKRVVGYEGLLTLCDWWCVTVREIYFFLPLNDSSPTLISFCIDIHAVFPSRLLALICSLPLLEDLILRGEGMDKDDEDGTIFQPSALPPLTGTLGLFLSGRVEHTARRLLDLKSGIRFREVKFTLYPERDLRWMTALAEACSDTLEHIDINDDIGSELLPFSLPYGINI